MEQKKIHGGQGPYTGTDNADPDQKILKKPSYIGLLFCA